MIVVTREGDERILTGDTKAGPEMGAGSNSRNSHFQSGPVLRDRL